MYPLREFTLVVNEKGSLLKGLSDYISIEVCRDAITQCSEIFASKAE
jgi:hypothetical protein